jgi:hypothetical protein
VLVLSAWGAQYAKKKFIPTAIMVAVAAALAAGTLVREVAANDDNFGRFHFQPDTLVVSRSVYSGDASILNVGQTLPRGCVPGTVTLPLLAVGSTTVAIPRSSKAPSGRAN